MSHATDNPVYCARKGDLGCRASTPGGKFNIIRAAEAGWFFSRQDECAYCPAHVPDWVPAWREKQAARRFPVTKTRVKLPATSACRECAFAETEPARDDDEKMRALQYRAYAHGEQTGHALVVTASQTLTIEPVKETADD